MLDDARLVAFVATIDLDRAVAFYGGTLGLEQVGANPGAAVFDGQGSQLRVTLVGDLAPDPFTVLGWDIPEIEPAVDALVAAGVDLLRYDGMEQDARGIWTTPGGDRVAWFHDPDGNTLSLTQHAAG
jgi:catechol 2,3-dioxygenase-like lactoylglutathione lyase family enzyme